MEGPDSQSDGCEERKQDKQRTCNKDARSRNHCFRE
jgi:hypothetical protein